MMLWFSELPSALSFVVTIALWNAIALFATWIARRWSYGLGIKTGSPVVNSWATCVGALCALLFAFSVVTLWNGTGRAQANVDDEAAAMRWVGRDISAAQLPLLRAYVNQSIDEWPALCGGKPDARVDASLVRLERLAKPRSSAYANDLYRQLGSLEDTRNRRWQTATSSVPAEIWVALIVLSCALLTVLAVAMPDRRETHLVLMVTVATAIGTLFWVTTLLEYPFCGVGAIGPQELLAVARAHL